ncbi:Na/Pi cotransporter family protein [Halanaerobium praevalens]|uniref:Na/Pi-cotransporter II-related protein n=1 Tax=Halanaerobium praevalens (strain ATCC 33744 / DSM 2228 / GSL) TaxID=572479 RepID=E3DQC6_HALPG|nr:Na/Pi cotransporter family protein [Halanaerobium praevalens]ADO77903.1 Na/Pi-cotransporter II-related protein [Halanaerobium praevalens DSM 2228]
MGTNMIIGLLGGLGLFIYGMKQMSEGLQKTAGKKLRHFLAAMTSKPIMGVGVGALVTSIIQSSSATTVMVVGFVNAGIMTLLQSVGVIMGANIGTTITAQLIAFKLGDYAFHAIAIGAFTYLFSKRKKFQYIGQVLLGFGLLFLGLETMGDTMEPLRDSQIFLDWMESFAQYPILGVLAGIVVTVAVQSSSASFGILLGLVTAGAINYEAAIPVLLGSNIGTTVTAILSAIGANLTAKRAAAAHFLFNVFGAGIIILFLYIVPDFSNGLETILLKMSSFFGQTGPSTERLLANTHTFFNVLNTLIWLPFTAFLVYLVKKIIPGEDTTLKHGTTFIDERMLSTPYVAIDQVKKEIIYMHGIAADMVCDSVKAFLEADGEVIKKVKRHEDIVNEVEEELLHFIQKIPQAQLNDVDIRTLDKYFAVVDDIESIADDANDITDLIEDRLEDKLKFSPDAQATIQEVYAIICNVLDKSAKLLETHDLEIATEILAAEEKLDEMQIQFRDENISRIKRSNKAACDPNSGILLLEILDDMEHISDQMADIAHSIMEIYQDQNLGKDDSDVKVV